MSKPAKQYIFAEEQKGYPLVGKKSFQVEDRKNDKQSIQKAKCLQRVYSSLISSTPIDKIYKIVDLLVELANSLKQERVRLGLSPHIELTPSEISYLQKLAQRAKDALHMPSQRQTIQEKFSQRIEEIYFYLNNQFQLCTSSIAPEQQKKALLDVAGKLKDLAKVADGRCSQGSDAWIIAVYSQCVKKDDMPGLLKELRRKILEKFKKRCSDAYLNSNAIESWETHLIEVNRQAYQLGFWDEQPITPHDDYFGSEISNIQSFIQTYLQNHLTTFYSVDGIAIEITKHSVVEIEKIVNEFKNLDLAELKTIEVPSDVPGQPGLRVTQTLDDAFLARMEPYIQRGLFSKDELMIEVKKQDGRQKFVNPALTVSSVLFLRCMDERYDYLCQGQWIGDLRAEIKDKLDAKEDLSRGLAATKYYQNKYQDTVLIAAVRLAEIFRIKFLLAVPIDPNYVNTEGMTALMIAVESRSGYVFLEPWQQAIVVRLFLQQPSINLFSGFNKPADSAKTYKVFGYAASEPINCEIMGMLLERATQDIKEKKADAKALTDIFNYTDPVEKKSPCSKVIESGDFEKFKVMLLHVPNLTLSPRRDPSKRYVTINIWINLLIAIREGNYAAAVDLFIKNNLKQDAELLQIISMQCAVAQRDLFFQQLGSQVDVEYLVFLKQRYPFIDINQQKRYHYAGENYELTPIGYCIDAIKRNIDKPKNKQCLSALLESKVDPNAVSVCPVEKKSCVVTPLMLATTLLPPEQEEIVEWLLEMPTIALAMFIGHGKPNNIFFAILYASQTSFELIINHLVSHASVEQVRMLFNQQYFYQDKFYYILDYLRKNNQFAKLFYLLAKVPDLELSFLQESSDEDREDIEAKLPPRALNAQVLISVSLPKETVDHYLQELRVNRTIDLVEKIKQGDEKLAFSEPRSEIIELFEQLIFDEAVDTPLQNFENLLLVLFQQCGKKSLPFYRLLAQHGFTILQQRWGVEHLLCLRAYIDIDLNQLRELTPLASDPVGLRHTPFTYAIKQGKIDRVKALLTDVKASSRQQQFGLPALLNGKVDPAVTDSLGMTPLMHATQLDSKTSTFVKMEIIACVLDSASTRLFDKVDEKGNTALHHYVASTNFYSHTFQRLIDHLIKEVQALPELTEEKYNAAMRTYLLQPNSQGHSILSLILTRVMQSKNLHAIATLLPVVNIGSELTTAMAQLQDDATAVLINLLVALREDRVNEAMSYYLRYCAETIGAPTESAVLPQLPTEVAVMVERQLGLVALQKFSKQIEAQNQQPTGLCLVKSLLKKNASPVDIHNATQALLADRKSEVGESDVDRVTMKTNIQLLFSTIFHEQHKIGQKLTTQTCPAWFAFCMSLGQVQALTQAEKLLILNEILHYDAHGAAIFFLKIFNDATDESLILMLSTLQDNANYHDLCSQLLTTGGIEILQQGKLKFVAAMIEVVPEGIAALSGLLEQKQVVTAQQRWTFLEEKILMGIAHKPMLKPLWLSAALSSIQSMSAEVPVSSAQQTTMDYILSAFELPQHTAILTAIVACPLWRDTRQDSQGRTLLMKAVAADITIFQTIAQKMGVEALIIRDKVVYQVKDAKKIGRTAMDYALDHFQAAQQGEQQSAAKQYADILLATLHSQLQEQMQKIKSQDVQDGLVVPARMMMVEILKYYEAMAAIECSAKAPPRNSVFVEARVHDEVVKVPAQVKFRIARRFQYALATLSPDFLAQYDDALIGAIPEFNALYQHVSKLKLVKPGMPFQAMD